MNREEMIANEVGGQEFRWTILSTLIANGVDVHLAMLWLPRVEALVVTGVDPGPPPSTPGKD